jgi:signal transduction histidine kinase
MANPPPPLAVPDRALVAGRWIAAFMGIVSSLPAAERADRSLATASACIIGLATWRTFRSFENLDRNRRRIWLLVESVITAIAVGSSSAWQSPFTSSLFVVVILAALTEDARGAIIGVFAVVGVVVAAGTVAHAHNLFGTDMGRLAVPLVLAAGVGVGVRRAVGLLRSQTQTQSTELQRLSDTNSLMVRLTKLTRAGGTIRDVREIAAEASSRFAVVFGTDLATLLQRNENGETWEVLAEHFGPHSDSTDPISHPTYANSEITMVVGNLQPPAVHVGTTGFMTANRAILVAPLVVRGEAIGAVVLERKASPFSSEESKQLGSMCEVVGLSLDNSRWFRRLRSMGAEDERTRIARELHDRLASSVAYLAFTFERLRHRYKDDADLAKAHDEARTTVGDLRDLLWQLRSGVTTTSPFAIVGVDLAERFLARTGIPTSFSAPHDIRLPLQIEAELLRITQEALNNVEKHAGATLVSIVYEPGAPLSRLVIADNGSGFDVSAKASNESFGLKGIRERADAIDAAVFVDSTHNGPKTGTRIRLEIDTDPSLITIATSLEISPLIDNRLVNSGASDSLIARELPIDQTHDFAQD